MIENTTTKFTHIVEALADYDHPFPPRMLRTFSDITPNHLRELKATWPTIKHERKVALLEDLENVAESDTLVNFDEFAKMALTDEDAAVRVLAIRLLWECEEARLVTIFTKMMLSDPADDVRAAAASALGKFVLLGELETLPEETRRANIQNLLEVVNGKDLPMVRRRALESLGFSSHPQVPELIEKAIQLQETQWVTSALYAMGRSADERWANLVQDFLSSSDSEVQFEAIRAAGELEIEDARDELFDLLERTTDDADLRYAIIWSLSQIGGESVKKKFEEMAKKCTDDEEAEWIEKALDNLELGADLNDMEMLEFEPEKNISEEFASAEDEADDEDSEDEDDEDDDLLDDEMSDLENEDYEN